MNLRSFNPFRILQEHRNFRLFWTGQTVSLIGTWMQQVAQGWLALELSDSAFVVGLVSAAGSLPVLLFSIFTGVLIDRFSKLRLVIVSQALLLVEASLLWWLTWTGKMTIPWLLSLATFAGLVAAVEIPARQSLIIELVGRRDIVDAVALNSGGFNLARIIGPSIAAIVISSAGLAWCFGINAISFLAVLASLLAIRLPPVVRAETTTSSLQELRAGLRYVVTRPEVTGIMTLMAVYSIFGFQYITLMPVLARDVLAMDASGYSLLLTFVGVGALAGALTLAAAGARVRRGRLFLTSAYSFPVLLILFSVARVPELAGFLLLLLGCAMLLNGALANGMLQSIAPDELRGRVMATYVMVYVGFTPVGSVVGGALARATNVQWAIAIGAIAMLFAAVICFWRYPQMADA